MGETDPTRVCVRRRGTAKSGKAATSHPPPIPSKSPPLTPTAAAAAAAAARAECKTFLSGEQEATDKDKRWARDFAQRHQSHQRNRVPAFDLGHRMLTDTH